MSRNLCTTSCHFCGREPVPVEDPRHLKPTDGASVYHDEYRHRFFMDAECHCGALYLAWAGHSWRDAIPDGRDFYDLSFRHAFNDEPCALDLPIWHVDQFGRRLGLIEHPEDPAIYGKTFWSERYDHESDVRGRAGWLARRETARASLEEVRRGA